MGIRIVWFELNSAGAREILVRPELIGDLVDIAVEIAYAHEGYEDGERFEDSPTDALVRSWVRAARQACWKSMMSLAGADPDPDYADVVHRFSEGDVSVRDRAPAITRYSQPHLLAAVAALRGCEEELRLFFQTAASRHGCVLSCYY